MPLLKITSLADSEVTINDRLKSFLPIVIAVGATDAEYVLTGVQLENAAPLIEAAVDAGKITYTVEGDPGTDDPLELGVVAASNVTITDTAARITGTTTETALAELAGRVLNASASETTIKAIPAAARANGTVIVDETNDVIWTFDSGSSASASSWVLVPDAGTGRWLRKDASLADLAAVTTAHGASLVGVEDAGTRITGVTVEAALQEALYKGDVFKITSTVGVEGAVAANAIEVACVVKDMLGVAITTQPKVLIKAIAATADKGDLAAAGTPVGTAGVTVNPATGANYLQMTPTNTGTFSFRVTDDQVESVVVEITGEGVRPSTLVLTFA